jgi:hypothetical protein
VFVPFSSISPVSFPARIVLGLRWRPSRCLDSIAPGRGLGKALEDVKQGPKREKPRSIREKILFDKAGSPQPGRVLFHGGKEE